MIRASASGTVVEQSSAKRRRVESAKKHESGQPITLEVEQAIAYDGKKMFVQEVMTPAAATNALAQTSQFSFIIENDATGRVNDVVLRFSVTVQTAATELLPVPLWFDRIEWYDRHSGREIARYHGDMLWWMIQTLPKDAQEVLADPVNFESKSGQVSRYSQQVGEQKYFYLPMPHNWIEGFKLDLSLLRGDLEIKFYPKGDCRTSTAGTAANVVLNEIRWIASSEMMSAVSRLEFRKEKAMSVWQHNYVDCQQRTEPARAYAANTSYTIDLDQFHHRSAMLIFCLRQNATGAEQLRYVPLGPTSTIDHENVHGRSMLGDGTPIDESYYRRWINSSVFGSEYVKYNAVYVIPFANELHTAWGGEIDGWHDFRGDRERIRFTTGGAPTVTSYRVQWRDAAGLPLAPTTNANNIRVGYKGDYTSAPINPLATTPAALTILLNELPSAIKDGVEFVITGGAFIGSNVFFTVSLYERGTYNANTLAGQPFVRKGSGTLDVSIFGDATAVFTELTTFTEGTPGFVAGTYQVDIYSIYHRNIQQFNGRLSVEDS